MTKIKWSKWKKSQFGRPAFYIRTGVVVGKRGGRKIYAQFKRGRKKTAPVLWTRG